MDRLARTRIVTRLIATIALLFGLLLAPAAVAAPVLSATATGGELIWGTKAGFRNVVTGIGAGKITASDGASKSGDTYKFTSAVGTVDAAGTIDATFTGSLNFKGMFGQIDHTFSNPRLTVSGSTGTLYYDVTRPGVNSPDLAIATVEAPDRVFTSNSVTLTNAKVKLTAEGSAVFNNMYAEGSEMDPLSATITFAEGALTAPVDWAA